MKAFNEIPGHMLRWERPSMLRREYYLSSNGNLLATLRFSGWPIGSLANGVSADGSWIFKREKLFGRQFIVRPAGTNSVLAWLRMTGNGWELDLADGRKFRWRLSRLRGQEWELIDPTDRLVFRYKPTLPPSRMEGEVLIEETALSTPQLSLLVLLSQYMMTFVSASIA